MDADIFNRLFETCFSPCYKLGDDGKTPEPCSPMEWAERNPNIEARTVGKTMTRDAEVSTVFLGMDHNFRFVGPQAERIPVLFETMVFGGKQNGHQWRYQTWEEAKAGHAFVVELVKAVEDGKLKPLPQGPEEEDEP